MESGRLTYLDLYVLIADPFHERTCPQTARIPAVSGRFPTHSSVFLDPYRSVIPKTCTIKFREDNGHR